MTPAAASEVIARLNSIFGEGQQWRSRGLSAVVWETKAYHLLWTKGSDSALQKLWKDRKGRQAYEVILLSPAETSPGDGPSAEASSGDGPSMVWVAGPRDARPVRKLVANRVLDLLEESRNYSVRRAASFLSREFRRLEESVVPGVRVKELLTPYYVRKRLLPNLEETTPKELPRESGQESTGATDRPELREPRAPYFTWQRQFEDFGYSIERLSKRGYLLRYDEAPVAVVHPYQEASELSRLTDSGELPAGRALADCEKYGASWGILSAAGRVRLFQRRPRTGAATGQYVEVDAGELEPRHRLYLELFAPRSLCDGGRLAGWIEQARDFGEELREGLEKRLTKCALPSIAQGIGEWLDSEEEELSNPHVLREVQEAALTLVFRFMFLLHTEARGYLPIESAVYRPHSATALARDALQTLSRLDSRSTSLWDRLNTLVRMVRTGNRSKGVPAYNGSLFGTGDFPGSKKLEEAKIGDAHLGPALAAIAYDTDDPDSPGLDYAGLDIGHMGAIYEALLTLRVAHAPEDLAYNRQRDVFRAAKSGENPEVMRAQLYYQAEKGGRKADGVFYTRHEFVRHLLNHSLRPALDAHLKRIGELAERRSEDAARRLFDFSVVDPAMGSAHFLTAALDMIADRIEIFLAEVGGLPGIAQMLSELSHGDGASLAQPDDGDLLRRLILKRCIYGVDISPMAVEVANVTLWLASFVPGLALSYLGSNLKCGNALIGVADPTVVGASDSPLITGNRVTDAMKKAAELQRELAAIPDRTPGEVKRSQKLDDDLKDATQGLRSAFHLWTAEPLGLEGARHVLETNAEAIIAGNHSKIAGIRPTLEESWGMADVDQYNFFHWPLEFPHIFHRDRRGFDVVVGNPPWKKVRFEMLSFLAQYDPGIKGLRSGLERDKRAERLFQRRFELRTEVKRREIRAREQRKFFRPDNGYTLQGRGDTDLYKLFCERYASIARKWSFIGVVLPRGAFLNHGSRGFRRWLFKECRPSRIDTLLNSGGWAFDIDPRLAIVLVTAQVGASADESLVTTGPARNKQEFENGVSRNGVRVVLASLASWTPAPANDRIREPTWELPLLPTPMHARVLGKLRCGVRFDRLDDPAIEKKLKSGVAAPHLALYTELHEAQQRHFFTNPPGGGRIPVWKGRSFGQYDPHGRNPAGFCDWAETLQFCQDKRQRSRVFKKLFPGKILADSATHPVQHCRVAFRDVTNRTNSRTLIACLIPPRTPLTHKAPHLIAAGWSALSQSHVLGILNSAPFDWLARRYVETNVTYFILNGLTFPRRQDTPWKRIGRLAARLSCVDERFTDFAMEAGVDCGPLTDTQFNDKRAEIDALVAAAYGLEEDELRFIFCDFTENAVTPAYRSLVLDKFACLK